jgi:hypothetical protein
MANGDQDPLQNFGSLHIAEQCDQLIKTMGRAAKEGVLTPLPQTEAQDVTDAFIAARLRTVRTRLFLLGYLANDNKRRRRDKKLGPAIKCFQEEAGLTVDGWVGPETWTALQELVSFEAPSNMARWVAGGSQVERALNRAVGLRLSALGFLKKPTRDQRDILRELRAFAGVASQLQLSQVPLPPTLTLETLTTLFDENALVRRLAAFEDGFVGELPLADEAPVLRFVAHVAKIELWLLGYAVELDKPGIDNNGHFPTPFDSQDHNTDNTDSRCAFYYALYSFWKDSGQGPAEARQSAAQGLSGAFFRRLVDVADEQAIPELDAAESKRLYTKIVAASQKKGLSAKIWKYLQNIGSRMWDGIRRAWLWFKGILKKAEPHLQWAFNLARLAYRYALAAFEKVRQPMDNLVKSAEFFLPETAPGSHPPDYLIYRDPDFDYYLLAGDQLQAGQLQALSQTMLRQAHYFRLGVRLLTVFVKAVVATTQAALLPGAGWFVFILSLVKIYGEVREVAQEYLTLSAV